jgi:type I restriction enzyme, S subunit
MSEWKEYTLGELVNLSQGQVINSKTNHLVVKEGIPLLRITDMINGSKTIFIDSEKVATKNIAFQDEIIYTRTGQVGLVFMNQYGVVHNNCFKVTPKDAEVVHKNFLFWYLKSNTVYEYINGVASGSAQPDLTHDSFKSLTINLPPLPTQQKIANILGTYDELIEVNNERIKLLEETAQALYKEWFVRFRFPNYQQTEFIKSVPKGWEIGNIFDLAEVKGGGTPSTTNEQFWNGNIPFYTPTDFNGNFFIFDTEKNITDKGLNNSSTKVFSKKTTFITARGTVGNICIAANEMAMNQSCFALLPHDFDNYAYLFLFVGQMVNFFKQVSTGATFDAFNLSTFKNYQAVIPKRDLILKFSDLINPMFTQIETLQQQNTELRQIRDRLLPRLISGKLVV